MSCDVCGSNRILSVTAKCSDCCAVDFNGADQSDYVPSDCGIGGYDYISFQLCLQCGKVQGEFPLDDPEFSQKDEDDENEDW